MLKLGQGKKTLNAARQHKGLHVSFLFFFFKINFNFFFKGYVGIFKYLFQSGGCKCKFNYFCCSILFLF